MKAAARTKRVYGFGPGRAEGRAAMRELLGGKGANLAEMARLGLTVPAGFTITTAVCRWVSAHDGRLPPGLDREIATHLARVERTMGRRFGDPADPLLLSVRSGAPASMPGMMDTVLNLGLSPATVEGLVRAAGDARFAWDCYRRFIQMFAEVVLGVKAESAQVTDPFETLLTARKQMRGVAHDHELPAEDLQALCDEFKDVVRRRLRRAFPTTRTSNCGSRSARCSARGTTRAR